MPVETAESKAMSKDMKKRGFKFVGPKIMYAFMQVFLTPHTCMNM